MTKIDIVPLTHEHLSTWSVTKDMERAYMSPGSVAYAMLANGVPVFAGGIVNKMWCRGESWILPTSWFRYNWRECYKRMESSLCSMAFIGGFKRVEAIGLDGISTSLFVHLGFEKEGTMRGFGPNGETCHMYARIFSQ